MNAMARLNVWSPFGGDHVLNAVAEAALQPAVDLAAARRVYDRRPPRLIDAEVQQRAEVDRLGEIVDGFADSTNTDRMVFRQMLQRKIGRDHGGSPDLSPLPPRGAVVDDQRRALDLAVREAEQAMEAARRRLASASRIHRERMAAHQEAERALDRHDRTRSTAP